MQDETPKGSPGPAPEAAPTAADAYAETKEAITTTAAVVSAAVKKAVTKATASVTPVANLEDATAEARRLANDADTMETLAGAAAASTGSRPACVPCPDRWSAASTTMPCCSTCAAWRPTAKRCWSRNCRSSQADPR